MDVLFQISTFIFAMGWWISAFFFLWQFVKIVRSQDASGISVVTFLVFALLNANATLYGYFTGNLWWIPGSGLASLTCFAIAFEAARRARSSKSI